MRLLAICTMLLLSSATAAADCLARELVVDRLEILHLNEPSHVRFQLPNSQDGAYFTYAAFHWLTGPGREPAAYVDHVLPGSQNVGISYTLYKIRVEFGTPNSADFWAFEADYSSGCTDVGRSILPGQMLSIKKFAIPPKRDGTSRDGEVMRIKIWGRHI